MPTKETKADGRLKGGTKIEWADYTFNPWIGCTKVDPLCKNCYAKTRDDRHLHGPVSHWGPGAPRVRTSAANWRLPLRWNNRAMWLSHHCEGCGQEFPSTSWSCCGIGIAENPRPRVFCASLADWLDDDGVPIEWLADLLALIHATPHLDWLLLTKRPGNWRDRISRALLAAQGDDPRALGARPPRFSAATHDWLLAWANRTPPANVWLGTSVGTQAGADTRIPELLRIPARVRFLSCEPLLEELDVSEWLGWTGKGSGLPSPLSTALEALPDIPSEIHWVICGGESGAQARPMHPAWARGLRDQCAAAGVPFFFKQWGEFVSVSEQGGEGRHHQFPDGATVHRIGKHLAVRTLDGVEHSAFPEARA